MSNVFYYIRVYNRTDGIVTKLLRTNYYLYLQGQHYVTLASK